MATIPLEDQGRERKTACVQRTGAKTLMISSLYQGGGSGVFLPQKGGGKQLKVKGASKSACH